MAIPSYLRVLIVEDTPVQALRVKLVLERSGCYVQWADTGHGGITSAQNANFDLVILDIELPDISGFEVCKRLKATPKLKDLPIIMMTTRDHAEDVLRGLDLGAVDYIPKDAFAEAVLVETVKHMAQSATPV